MAKSGKFYRLACVGRAANLLDQGTVQGVDDLHDADVIAYRGGRFRAERIESWGDGFSEVLAVRIQS